MKLTLLVDNHTVIDRYFRGEPAFACHIQDGSTSILLDAGYSDLTVTNAAKLGIDLGALDVLALSHGHNDHTGGIPALLQVPRSEGKGPLRIAAHPAAVEIKENEGENIGCPVPKEQLAQSCRLELSSEPQKLSPNVTLLGRIARTLPFEPTRSIGRRRSNGVWLPDGLPDDTALCCKTVKGIFIVTGCAHSGICNVIQYARSTFPGQQICGVLGGFHLLQYDERAKETVKWLAAQNIPVWYPCHCTGLRVKGAMFAAGMNIQEAGVGSCIEI